MYSLFKNEGRIRRKEKENKVERRKMEKMSQFRIQYINTWRCYNETLYIDVLNKKKSLFFSKMEDRKVKQVLSGGWYQWEGEDIRKGCGR
jgi:hypothetical protein